MTLLRYDRQIEDFLRKGNYLRSGMRILDAGCGSGLATKILHGLVKEQHLVDMTFHGFDLTPTMLKRFQTWITKHNLQREIEFNRANVLDLQELPEHWSNYDLIVSSSMLEYIPQLKIVTALQNLRALLKGDGTLLLFVTRENPVTHRLVGKWWQAHLFSEDEIYTALSQAGFHQILPRQFSGRSQYANTSTIAIEALP